MKLSAIIAAVPSIQLLAGSKLPAKASYRVAKALKVLQPELEEYETQRLKLAKQYGVPNADNTGFDFTAENAPKFSAEMQTLLDEEVTITLTPVHIDDLGSLDIEPSHLVALDGILLTDAE